MVHTAQLTRQSFFQLKLASIIKSGSPKLYRLSYPQPIRTVFIAGGQK